MPTRNGNTKHIKVMVGGQSPGMKSAFNYGGKMSTMLFGFVAFGVLFGSYLLISSRAAVGNTNTALPPSDVKLCKNPENPAAGTRYDWYVALNNKTSLCSQIIASLDGQLYAMGDPATTVYKYTKTRYLVDANNTLIQNAQSGQVVSSPIVLGYSLANKPSGVASDVVQGDDSVVPAYANGSGLPGYAATCRVDPPVSGRGDKDFLPGDNTLLLVFTMVNTGSTTWTPGSYKLSHTAISSDVFGPGSDLAALTQSVAPGQKFDFTAKLTMPIANGRYQVNAVMTRDGKPFGAIAICDNIMRMPSKDGWFDWSGTVAATTSPSPAPANTKGLPASVGAGTNIAKTAQDFIKTLPTGTTAIIKNANFRTPATDKTITTTTDVNGMAFQSGEYTLTIKNVSGQIIGWKKINIRKSVPVSPLGG